MDLHDLAKTVMQRCEVLAAFTETPGMLTRTFLSDPMHGVHASIREWMTQAGLQVRVDAVGNIIGRKVSHVKDAKVLLMGSHLDTVKNAGKYDGILGVLIALALAETLVDKQLPFHLDVIGFSEEEGVRFGVPFIGSKAIAGTFDTSLLELNDANGISVSEAIGAFGLNPDTISEAAYNPENVLGYLEAHIEQGLRLAATGAALGVVSAIVGASRAKISFFGSAGHAGTSPMNLRHDALTGAAEFILSVESYARQTPELVATVGCIEARPGAGNVIAGEVELSLDVRHIQDTLRYEAVQTLKTKAESISQARNLSFQWQDLMDQAAVPMAKSLIQLLKDAASPNIPVLSSGAGHDAMIMATLTPSAMLFVRSPNGMSHNPKETVLVSDVELALQTLVRVVENFSKHKH
jgi:allantoate deiminase